MKKKQEKKKKYDTVGIQLIAKFAFVSFVVLIFFGATTVWYCFPVHGRQGTITFWAW